MASLKALLGLLGSGVATALGCIAPLVLLFAGIKCFNDFRDSRVDAALAPLNVNIDDYLAVIGESRHLPSSEPTVLAGKPVFVCMKTNGNIQSSGNRVGGEVDPLMLSLPSNLRPESAEEVTVLVALYWGEESVGSYDNGDSAYRETCLVEVIDMSSGRQVQRKAFVGGDPPEYIDSIPNKSFAESHYGIACDEDILEFVSAQF